MKEFMIPFAFLEMDGGGRMLGLVRLERNHRDNELLVAACTQSVNLNNLYSARLDQTAPDASAFW